MSCCTTASRKYSNVPEEESLDASTISASFPPTSLQLVISPLKISESCSIVRLSTPVTLALVTTHMASMATTTSTSSTPSPLASSNSLSLAALEAFPISFKPFMASDMPVPDPPPLTTTEPPYSAIKASATKLVMGSTVVDPEILISWPSNFLASPVEDSSVVSSTAVSSAGLQPANTVLATNTIATARLTIIHIFLDNFFSFLIIKLSMTISLGDSISIRWGCC